MRPLHTDTRAQESSTLRKTSSRLVLQIQEGAGERDNRQQRVSYAKSSSTLASSCDTLFIILALAVFLSIVGMVFVHRMFVDSSAANNSLLDQETRGTGQGGWGSQHGHGSSFYP
jgi:hypothetical protein